MLNQKRDADKSLTSILPDLNAHIASQSKKDDFEEDIANALHASDSMTCQAILSYSYSITDDWKLDAWRHAFVGVANYVGSYIISLSEVENIINTSLRKAGALYVVPSVTLLDLSRTLVNTRWLLLKSSVLKHVSDPYTFSNVVTFRSRTKQLPSPTPVEVKASSPTSTGYVGRATTGIIYFAAAGLAKLYDFLVESTNSNVYEESGSTVYLVQEHMRIPYEEPLTKSPLDGRECIIVSSILQKLSDSLLDDLQNGNLKKKNLLSTGTLEYSNNVYVISEASVKEFLLSHLGKQPTSDSLSIFIWYLSYFSHANVRPFECGIDGSLYEATDKNKKNQQCSSYGTQLRGIKITFDHNSFVEISPTDIAALLEDYAEQLLRKKLDTVEARAVAAQEECVRHLKLQHKEAALISLKKKKMFETEIETLQQELLRVEEARHMRDSTSSLNLVANVITSTLQATKLSSLKQSELVNVIEELNDTLEETKATKNLFSSGIITNFDMETIEQEYESLLVNEASPTSSTLKPLTAMDDKEYRLARLLEGVPTQEQTPSQIQLKSSQENTKQKELLIS